MQLRVHFGHETFFVLENLDNLLKNGRMSKLAVKLTTLLGISLYLARTATEI
jgi:fatty acid-binding protein DegV